VKRHLECRARWPAQRFGADAVDASCCAEAIEQVHEALPIGAGHLIEDVGVLDHDGRVGRCRCHQAGHVGDGVAGNDGRRMLTSQGDGGFEPPVPVNSIRPQQGPQPPDLIVVVDVDGMEVQAGSPHDGRDRLRRVGHRLPGVARQLNRRCR
jgi:hypothetical protein